MSDISTIGGLMRADIWAFNVSGTLSRSYGPRAA